MAVNVTDRLAAGDDQYRFICRPDFKSLVDELRALYGIALARKEAWKVFVFHGSHLRMSGHPVRILTDVDGTTAELGTSATPVDDADVAHDLVPRPPG